MNVHGYIYNGGEESYLSSICGPIVIAGFSTCKFTVYEEITSAREVSKEVTGAGDCNTFKIECLKGSFFISSTKGTRILILFISCSKLKGDSCLFVSLTFETPSLIGC
jgi:hypothetical protein